MPRLSIRIYFDHDNGHLGPGMAQILEGVDRLGSIRLAAAAMGMGYRKAWLLIQQMQDTFGGEVVETVVGGRSGGGAVLTERGRCVLTNFRALEARAAKASAGNLAQLSDLAAQGLRKRAVAKPAVKSARRPQKASTR